ncbi:hypothetical protein [Boseongicola aestuarii]|uniref:Uncharacterized protein n=1 Tax=Boseongicola aestuarii TaxID=1470561 RepID=A0A238J0C4_9RHOB|nr:hypothetical protein [Boseongicola aestuarii]SMX24169.1 hypothetical protein BOA8489_02292 [Boseongicola aestuarii]
MNRTANIALFAATLVIYLVMVLWSLPRIAEGAGGLIPFDLRPGGYSVDEARAFLAAIDAETTVFYLTTQHRIDLLYPALLAASLAAGLIWSWRRGPRWLVGGFILLGVLGAVADYTENARVAVMLRAGPDALTVEMVDAASKASMAKAGLTTLATLALVVGLVRRARRRIRSKG